MVRFVKYLGVNVVVEVLLYYFILIEEDVLEFGINVKMNLFLRSKWDRDKIIEGLNDGIIEIIVIDYVFYSKEEKDREFIKVLSGIIGFEIFLVFGIINLVYKNYFSMM